jgi:sugar O-acyltransferase (sialic acid O-acetyltransferase NeuD family)
MTPVPREPTPLIVIGGGGHARSVLDAALAQPHRWHVLGFVDPDSCPETAALMGVPQLGGDAAALAHAGANAGTHFVLAVGNVGSPAARRAIAARYGPVHWATVVHPTATVAPSAQLDPGAIVLAGGIVNAGAVVGAHAIVNTGAILEHDVHVGAFVHLGPGAVVGGGARIDDDAFLGLGCRVRDHIRIGERAEIAMGSVVTADVASGEKVWGVPAKKRQA